jgi:hypothetical protein
VQLISKLRIADGEAPPLEPMPDAGPEERQGVAAEESQEAEPSGPEAAEAELPADHNEQQEADAALEEAERYDEFPGRAAYGPNFLPPFANMENTKLNEDVHVRRTVPCCVAM